MCHLCGRQVERSGDVVTVDRRQVLLSTKASLELGELMLAERRARLATSPARPEALGARLGDQLLMMAPLLLLLLVQTLTAARQ